MPGAVPLRKLIVVPALITLAITLLRLVGELLHWSPTFFSREPGGGGAIVGIAWLVPIFGIYFALRLAAAGERPPGAGAAVGLPFLGFALVPAAGFAAAALGAPQQSFVLFGVLIVFSVVGGLVAYRAWPELGRALLAYGFAARIPVAIVMLFAILGSWGTHYDAVPPDFPEMAPLPKWVLIGLLPQLTMWMWYTVAFGSLCGGIAVVVRERLRARRPAAA